MATLKELAELADAAYGTPSAISFLLSDNWIEIDHSSVPEDNYYGVAYENTVTHEVVVSNRGTQPSSFKDLFSDARLATHVEPQAALDAIDFAKTVAQDKAGLPLTIVGHSLGGYEAQVALAYLVDNNVDVSASAVTFQAPGVGAGIFHGTPSSYNVLNLYNQGDVIHLAGGTHLGVTASLAAGATLTSEFADGAAAFGAGLIVGPVGGLIASGAVLSKDFLGAHPIALTLSYLSSTPSIGGETPTTFIDAGQGFTPSPLLTTPVPGSLSLNNGQGDSFNLQMQSSGSFSETVGVGSDGVITPTANVAALDAELGATGTITVAENQSISAIQGLEGASSVFATANPSINGNAQGVIGSTPTGLTSGLPSEISPELISTDGRVNFNAPVGIQMASEEIIAGPDINGLWVNGNNQYIQLTGGLPVSGAPKTWTLNGITYTFAGAPDSTVGTLTITGSLLGANLANSIVIQDFNLSAAQSESGFMGIFLPATVSLNASANSGIDPPAPSFSGGSNQSYTLSVEAPSPTAQTFTVTLSGAAPSDFDVNTGDSIEQISNNGTFAVVLAAGETNVAFTLEDLTSASGAGDLAAGASLQLSASVPNPNTIVGGFINTGVLTFNYVPQGADTAPAPVATSMVTGVFNGSTGVTTFTGDGLDDLISGSSTPNLINAQNSGNDSITGGSGSNTINGGGGNSVITLSGADLVALGGGFNTVLGSSGHDTISSVTGQDIISGRGGTDVMTLGNGNNAIYANIQTSIANCISLGASGTATGVQGDFISVHDGNNTVVGGSGNDLITAGAGQDIVVMGPGNDTFDAGIEITAAASNWSTTFTQAGTVSLTLNNVSYYPENYSNPYPQPYEGVILPGQATIAGPANDTVFGGKGNDVFFLGNGNNYVETGNGNDVVANGMGNDTIIAGSGNDYIFAGGGAEYVYGGAGTDTIFGGDGNNTIIGGSGNSTLGSAQGPTNSYANANLEQNYVTGGSGNDLILGSAGNDTLLAGSGNSSVYGGTGNEDITGGPGNDLLAGGSGNSTIAAAGSGQDSLYANGSSTSTSVLYGGDGKDLIVGGSGRETINAGDGGTAGGATSVFASSTDATAQTTIYGGDGTDFVQGGIGNSLVYAGDGGGGAAPTTVLSLSGNDTIYGGLGTDFLQGGSGNDVIYAGDGGTANAPTTVLSGSVATTLYGGAGEALLQDTVSGDDLIVSETADDTLTGLGNDTLVTGTGNDRLNADNGDTNIDIAAGFGVDTVFSLGTTYNLAFGTGLAPTDFAATAQFDLSGNTYAVLSGDGGSITLENALTGNLGSVAFADSGSIALPAFMADVFGSDQTIAAGLNNILVSVANGDSVAGGFYDDTISSWGTNATITGGHHGYGDIIYSAGASASIASGSGLDSIIAAGNNDTITDGASADHITVTGANDLVADNIGADIITASGTNDTINAISGISQFFVNDASTVIHVTGTVNNDAVFSSVSYTAPTNIVKLTLTGSANITATGNGLANVLTGGAGNDTLVAGSAPNTLVGGAGNTTFVVNSASDVVQDSLSGASNTVETGLSYSLGTNVNTLMLTGTNALMGTANSANDTLVSNAGLDTLVGGAGNDTFIISNPLDVVIDSLGTATIIYQSATNFTLPTNVNVLTLTGTAAVHATGNAGNDSITANSGADTLSAGNGSDTLVSGSGIDSLVGGTGADLFVVNNANDVVNVGGTHGADTVQASVSFSLAPNVATLTLTGTSALQATGNNIANLITANGGSDTLTAGSGIATLVGGTGNDTFVVDSTSDLVQDSSSASSNTVRSSVSYSLVTNVNSLVLTGTAALVGTGNTASDTLTSNSGVDTLAGQSGNDTFVIGNSGDVIQDSVIANNSAYSSVSYSLPFNVSVLTLTGTAALSASANAGTGGTLVSNTGVDTLSGGGGTVFFIVNNAADVVSVGASHGSDTIQTAFSYTLPSNVNDLVLTGSSNLTAAAVTGNNEIVGNAGNDVLKAGTGLDTLVAGTGIDTLIGGAGPDIFVVGNAADVLQSVSSAVGNTVISSVNYSMGANISVLSLSGTANLSAMGNSLSDTLTANSGNDTLIAGTGVATLNAGLGSDLFVVNSASDVITDSNYTSKAGVDTIQSSVSLTLPAVVDVLVLSGTLSLTATGNAHANYIQGNSGSDHLIAGSGDDTLVSGSGVSTMVAGAGSGDETFIINNASDIIQASVASHNNVLISSVSYTAPTNVNTLELTGTANVKGTANAANDSLEGNAGLDTLVAGAGTDTLVAGSGLATLVGGSGADVFVVNNASDVIQSASSSAGNAVFSSASFTLPTNVNVLTLTGNANVAGTGNAAADTLTAGTGQDTLVAGAGVSTMIGGSWSDTFVVNNVGDVVQDSSTGGSNTIVASVNYSLVTNVNTLTLTGTGALKGTANGANDTLSSNSGVDTLVGGTGSDTFVINNSADVVQDTTSGALNIAQASVNYSLASGVSTLILTGTYALKGTANSGADTLYSNGGADTFTGGAGNDLFVVNSSADVVTDTSTTASNTIESYANYTLPTHVNALTLAGTNSLIATGNGAANVITANSGNDTLVAGTGVATLVGGAGNDTFVVNNSGDVIQDSMSSSVNVVQASASYSLAANVNNLVLSGTASLTGAANGANDTLTSNSGVDTLIGGAGHDVFVINNSSDVIVNATTNDTIESSVSYNLPAGVDNLVLLGSANLAATGNSDFDTIVANAGNDTLTSGSAPYTTLIGGAGNDTFVVNTSGDVIQDSSTSSNNVVVSSATFYSLPANVDTLTLIGSAALTAYGNQDSNNVINANSGNDYLSGSAFSNTINGGIGSDTIEAGPLENLIYAGNGGTSGQPTLVYGNAAGTTLATTSTIYGGSGVDILYGGPGSDLIYGGSGSTSIIAGTGSDSLYGVAGDSLVDSSGGFDYLSAGSGAETLSGMGSDTLIAGTGNDSLSLNSGSGQSLIEVNAGSGQSTLGGTPSTDANLLFGAGIEPSALTVTAQTFANEVGLVFADGSTSLIALGGLQPGVLGNISFVDTGSESFDQLMRADGPGFSTLTAGGEAVTVSGADSQNISVNSGGLTVDAYAFGNDDNLADLGLTAQLYAYGANDTVAGSTVWIGSSSGSVALATNGTATLAGANDTLVGSGGNTLTVSGSGDVISEAAGTLNTVDSYTNFTLPTNVQTLVLESIGISGTSNSTGGVLNTSSSYDTLTGGSGADSLNANGSYDVLVGGSGIETYYLSSSTDSIVAGTGNASLNSIQAAFSYTLGAGANRLVESGNAAVGQGNSASDTLTGTGSGDTLAAGSGNDLIIDNSYSPITMIGGSGNDTFSVRNSQDVIVDTSATASNSLLSSANFTLPNHVNALFLEAGSTLIGTANSGNDSLTALGGFDTLVASTGTDTLTGTAANDTFQINSGFTQDVITPTSHGVVSFGTGIAKSGLTFSASTVSGGASLVISGYGGSVTVQGGLLPGDVDSISFADGTSYTVPQLVAPSGRATVAGSGGNLILSPSNADSVTGGSGQDTIIAWGNNDTLKAGTGGTAIYSAGASASITGGAAVDTLSASGSHDTLVGGSGTESLFVNDPTTVVQVSAGVGHDTVYSSVSYSVPTNVTSMTLTASGIVGYANSASDKITATAPGDTFYDSGISADTFVGSGAGTEHFNVNNPSDIVIESAYSAGSTVFTSVNYTLPTNVADLVLTSSGLVGMGSSSNGTISDEFGGDTLVGGTGATTLIDSGSDNGFDTMIGGSGPDVFETYSDGVSSDEVITGSGIATIAANGGADSINSVSINNSADVFANGLSLDNLNTSVSYTLSGAHGGAPAINWSLTGAGNITADDANSNTSVGVGFYGNAGNDSIVSSSIDNVFHAGSGVDTFVGAGTGTSNTFYVNNSADVITAQAGANNVVYSSVNFTLISNISTLNLTAANLMAIDATSGNNVLSSGGTGDTLISGSGHDTIESGSTNVTIVATSGSDYVEANTGDVVSLNGFGSTEISVGPLGATATIAFGPSVSSASLTASAVVDNTGQAGLVISNGSTAVTLDGALSDSNYQFSFNGGGALTLAQLLESISVTTSTAALIPGNVVLEATPGVSLANGSGEDTLYALAANDTLTGGNYEFAYGNSDYLVGGQVLTASGLNDTLVGGTGFGTLTGASGASVLFVVNAANQSVQVQGTPGVDTIESAISYTLPTNVNKLVLIGTSALLGHANSGADTLISNSAIDTLQGGSGSDYFIINNASDVVTDTSSSAVNTVQSAFSYSLPTDVNNLLLTGTAALTGRANSGTDTLTSNSGVDALFGGSGNDTFILNNVADTVTDTSTTATNSIQAAFSYSLPTNVNSLVLLGTAALTGTANGGTDTLTSNSGADILNGGAATDTFVINNASDVINDTSTTTTNTALSSVSFSLATNVNRLTLTGTAALAGTANGGTDTLTSNSGLDTLVGGAGNDTFVINNSADVIQDTTTGAVNTAQSGVSYSLATNVNNLLLTGSAAIVGTANGGADSLTGNVGASTLQGGAGIDTLVAGGAANTLIGGSGNTTFVVNNTSDAVQDSTSGASNVIRSSVTYSLITNVNSLVLTGTAALKGSANGGADTLTSNTGVDTLVGGAGNDTFIISNAFDIIQDTASGASNAIQSTVSFTLPLNVNALTFTGGTALVATGNAGNDSLTANTGSDTLIAGNGTDTLVSGTSGTDSLVGGTGTDLFFVNNTADIVTVGSSHGVDTIQSSVSYTASANVANLVLSGTSALVGTGNATFADKITANSGADTLIAGGGADTLVGGAGNDTFVVNSASDVVQDTSGAATNILDSSVSYTLVTNVNRLILTGTAALVGTANSGNDTLTANTGADTLVSGAGTAVDSLVGGTGADLFIVNNASDIVNVGSTHGVDTIQSSVSYSASANVANLTLTGTAALAGIGNSLAGTITANSGADTLTAGSGADTLVGGTGADLMVVNSASDVVSVGTSGTNDTIQSSANYTLSANVQYLTLSGSGALAGTGNTITDLILGNSGNDTLTGGTGIAVLEGGRTAGSDQIKATGNQAALIAGAGASTLTGGAFKDFYAAGKISDSITTGATANVVSINKGDGATTLAPTTGATNVLSLGAGIDTENLTFTKTGNNLILSDAVGGDSITFTNWYTTAQSYTTLQVVEIASANYNSAGSDNLRNKALEDFNLTALVAAYNAAGAPANWALSTAMPTTQIASSSTAAYGGDLAYYYGLNGNLTGVDLTAAQSTLTNSSYGTAQQTIDSFSSITGGGGLHLAVVTSPRTDTPIAHVAQDTSVSTTSDINMDTNEISQITPKLGQQAIAVQSESENSASAADTTTITPSQVVQATALSTSGFDLASLVPGHLTQRFSGVDLAAEWTPRLGIQNAFTANSQTQAAISAPATSASTLPSVESKLSPSVSIDSAQSNTSGSLFSELVLTLGKDNLLSTLLPRFGEQAIHPVGATAPATQTIDAPPAMSQAASATPAFTPVTASAANKLLATGPGELPEPSPDAYTKLQPNFVNATNVAWLNLHDTLDQLAQLQGGGAETIADHESSANEALLGSQSSHVSKPERFTAESPLLHRQVG